MSKAPAEQNPNVPKTGTNVPKSSTNAPRRGPMVPTGTDGMRRPFTRNITVNTTGRTHMVIGGLLPPDEDGHRPFVGPMAIAKALGLDSRACLLCDPRELGKIAAGRAARLREVTVEHYVKAREARK